MGGFEICRLHVQDAGRAVVLGHLVLVGRVPPHALERRVDVLDVGDPRQVELREVALLDHARDELGGRRGDVVAGRAACELRQQDLVVVVDVVGERLDPELLLERFDVVGQTYSVQLYMNSSFSIGLARPAPRHSPRPPRRRSAAALAAALGAAVDGADAGPAGTRRQGRGAQAEGPMPRATLRRFIGFAMHLAQ